MTATTTQPATPARSVADRNALALSALGLAKHIVLKHRDAFWVKALGDLADAHQTAIVGLLIAAGRYDESRGVKFSSFAYVTIVNALRTAARHAGLVRGNAATHQWPLPVGTLTPRAQTTLPARPPDLDAAAAREAVRDALDALDERSRTAIADTFLDGQPVALVARRLRVCAGHLYAIRRRALGRLRDHILAAA